jgi:thymidine kinase
MINTYVGPMFSGKSDSLINIYNKIWNKSIVIAFKPKNDSRDEDYIKSKNSDVKIPAIYISNLKEIKKYVVGKNIHTVFIDEAQFLKGDVRILVELSVLYDIDFYIAGLNMTSEQKPFGLMPKVMAVSDYVEVIKGFCVECNKESVYTYHEGEKTGDVLVGDNGYTSLCPNCLKKKMLIRKKGK